MVTPTPNPPVCLFTVAAGISTEDLLVNLSETLASANALSCDLTFDLEGPKREELLGVTQLIELAQLLADWILTASGQVNPWDDGQYAEYPNLVCLAVRLLRSRGIGSGPDETIPDALLERLGLSRE